ncbi:hypothetical protein BGZ58_001257 [Dissophora ornata]|nr:hypothetical protein BGZ58_001257 [Dissophora ornata]
MIKTRKVLDQLPIQHFEPLVSTVDGYCTAFHGLCKTACEERTTRQDMDLKTTIAGCAYPLAKDFTAASATCQCAEEDLTERVNFAVIGGVVSSGKLTSGNDFLAQGLLDHLTGLPLVPVFLSVIHFLQNLCFSVSFLDVFATNPHPPPPCIDKGPDPLPNLGGFINGIIGKVAAPALPTAVIAKDGNTKPTLTSGGGIGGFFDGIFGGGKKSAAAGVSTPTPTSIAGGRVGVSGDGKKSTTTAVSTPTPTPTTRGGTDVFGDGKKSTTTAVSTPTPAPTNKGGIAGIFDNIFGGGKKAATGVPTLTPTPTTTAVRAGKSMTATNGNTGKTPTTKPTHDEGDGLDGLLDEFVGIP